MKTEVISTCIPSEIAQAIRDLAEREDRSISKVAGRILLRGYAASPVPQVQFARRRTVKPEGKR